MNRWTSAVLLCAIFGFANLSVAAITFEDLLEEALLRFDEPTDFRSVEPRMNGVLPYEKALRHIGGGLEIRYAIRPIGRLSIEYDDPHNAAPQPNHLFDMMFRTLVGELSSGGNTPLREFPPDQALDRFNADWAAAAVFDVADEFDETYEQGLLIALHKNNQADAYVVFLFNDYAAVKPVIDRSMSTLSFRH